MFVRVGDLVDGHLAEVVDPLQAGDFTPRVGDTCRLWRLRKLVIRIHRFDAVLGGPQTQDVGPNRAAPPTVTHPPRPPLGVGQPIRIGVDVLLGNRHTSRLGFIRHLANLVPLAKPERVKSYTKHVVIKLIAHTEIIMNSPRVHQQLGRGIKPGGYPRVRVSRPAFTARMLRVCHGDVPVAAHGGGGDEHGRVVVAAVGV